MRAMILAAGLGTRLRPLTDYRAKPALPVRGRPVISLLLALLEKSGVREVMINLHHRPETIRAAVERDHPENLALTWSVEDAPLGTGGGIRRAAEFLRESEDCVVMAGDMLLDLDLEALRQAHRESERDVSIVLRDDPRTDRFGSIGIDEAGRIVRVGRTPVAAPGAGTEARAGLFTSVRFFRREALDAWPAEDLPVFEDLRDWLIPRAERGEITFGAHAVAPEDSVWEPVGTPAEYLDANLAPPALPNLGGSARDWSGPVTFDEERASILSKSATVDPGARLERCVVWEDEHVPAGFQGSDGVVAGGTFHSCYEAEFGGAK